MHIYTYTHTCANARRADPARESLRVHTKTGKHIRSTSEISSCFFGPRPWHIEIRHRVKKTSTINLLGFETLKLKIRRLKLWKPTARNDKTYTYQNSYTKQVTKHT